MTRIPSDARDLLEKAIYYPMLIKVLEKDLNVINNSHFKLKKPYVELVEQTLNTVHKQLYYVKKNLKKQELKAHEVKRDDTFTTYLFVYKGYEEYHSYFNPRLRNHVEELLRYYLFGRFENNRGFPNSSSSGNTL